MYNLFLLSSMIACIQTQALLSMLLFLILTYLAAAVWLISQKLIYAGLLYVLVYVGAIVVLFVYVIQLVDTVQLNIATLNPGSNKNKLLTSLLSFNFLTGLLIFITGGYLVTQTNFSLASLNTDTNFKGGTASSFSLTTCAAVVNKVGETATEFLNINFTNNLDILAQNLFNNYSYVLLLTVTAIILAIIGPVNLALETKQN